MREQVRAVRNKKTWMEHLLSGYVLGFFITALYHVLGIVDFSWIEPSPLWRHGLFIGINLGLALGTHFRPRGFGIFAWILLLQQLYSHGTQLFTVWQMEDRIDWSSVIVLVALPLWCGLIHWVNRKRNRSQFPSQLLQAELATPLPHPHSAQDQSHLLV